MPEWVQQKAEGIAILVKVQPKASKNRIQGPHGAPARLKIAIAAPPVDGAANEELVRFLAKHLGIPRSSVFILRGHGSRQKDVLCAGISEEKALALLAT